MPLQATIVAALPSLISADDASRGERSENESRMEPTVDPRNPQTATLAPPWAAAQTHSRYLRSLLAARPEIAAWLAENAGRVVSRSKLLDQVWDLKRDPGTNLVDVYISYLRAKIDKGHERALIHTVRGLGYVLEDRPA